MAASFKVYIDESGDEGFFFKPDGSGSPRWFVLSALVIRSTNDPMLVTCLKEVRELLQKPKLYPLHFRNLKHDQRVAYVKRLGDLPVKTISILIHKPSLDSPENFQSQKFLLYRYCTRLLMERVSWLVRDSRLRGQGDGSAEVIFSNRSAMSYEEIRAYLNKLKGSPQGVRIDWSAHNTRQHSFS